MVLAMISVLTVMLTEIQDEVSTEMAGAMGDRDSVQAEYLARSAINLARLLVASEPTVRQSVAPLFLFLRQTPPQIPVWEFADYLLGMFSDSQGGSSFTRVTGADLSSGKNLKLGNGYFEISVVDEDRMINVNSGASNDIAHLRLARQLMGLMAPPQYNSLFEQVDEQGEVHDRLRICQAIIDWADEDERAFSCDFLNNNRSSGVEDNHYYELLPKPYRAKNSSYDSLEELRMVRGIGDEFWSTFIDPDPAQPSKRNITVWGQGTINVNTASPQTLLALLCSGSPQADICLDANQSQLFIMAMTMARGLSMGAPLFGKAEDFMESMKGRGAMGPIMERLGLKPIRFLAENDFKLSIGTESKVFSIYAIGIVKRHKREVRTSIHAVVDFRSALSLLKPTNHTTNSARESEDNSNQRANETKTDSYSPLLPTTAGNFIYYRIH
ncbi:general secretion pathway protein GspK [Pajaroellobacter abortibovis]|nr:type II secretion system protein GspK [Pajaroellobacter abortibovis]